MKLIERTPISYVCGIGPCPSVFETEHGTYLVVGKKVSGDERAALPQGKVAPDEDVVEVPIGLIQGLLRR